MSLRLKALKESGLRSPVAPVKPGNSLPDFYGCNVFDMPKMEKHLSKKAYLAVEKAIKEGTRLDRADADEIAAGMKQWAVERGATHYAHWFQPLTGATAEKHDSFLDFDYTTGKVIENFSGKLLVQQEPDASSFPSGGIRSTFEARGYTAWDPSSPAFVIGSALCIPSIFISYTGESLDYKAPLLKADQLLNKAATAVAKYFDEKVTKVQSTLGWEQEYFLVDISLYNSRPDLILTGRTLFGASAAKDQQLEDHYFGTIPERALAFIEELEIECYKLGIPAKTRHNEVAPNQFEIAPIFEPVDIAVDHNILLMDIMKRIGRKHNFMVLLHEKPFAGVNGSGKHNNWSMSTNTGVNLLQPGKTPETNLRFLTFLVNVVKAVHDNTDLFLASVASSGNEHRLGANEAPPAIISVFLGSQLSAMLERFENNLPADHTFTHEDSEHLHLDIEHIPQLLMDNTDRNRTSPFAFTGNKFEFRAIGSSANCAPGMITVNAAVAKQLVAFKAEVDTLIANGAGKEEAILSVLHAHSIASKNVRFDGNNYSKEWEKEAAKRGLPNIRTAPEAWKAYTTQKAHHLFCESHIYTERELESRYEVFIEAYIKKIAIEAKVAIDIARSHIVPAAVKYQNILLENFHRTESILGKKAASGVKHTAAVIATHLNAAIAAIEAVSNSIDEADNKKSLDLKAKAYSIAVKKAVDALREEIDALERHVDNEMWPLPKYRELLFIK